MSKAHATIDHERIKSWAEQRGGHPATVAATGEQGILRIDFDPPDEKLEEVEWDDFFETFDQKSLAFLYQDKTQDGKLSRFSKFIDRNSAEAADLAEVADDDAEAGKSSKGKSAKSTKSASTSTAKRTKSKSSHAKMDGAASTTAKSRSGRSGSESTATDSEDEGDDMMEDEE
jgi:hypothetical protein